MYLVYPHQATTARCCVLLLTVLVYAAGSNPPDFQLQFVEVR